MSTPELKKYIKDSLDKGKSKEDIRKTLIDGGWDQKDVDQELNMDQSDDNLPPPPPPGHGSMEYRHLSNPLNSIVYIISFILLLTVIYSGMFAFGIAIDYYLSPQTNSSSIFSYSSGYDGIYQAMTLSLSTFIISLPIYLLTVWFLRSDENKRPIIRKSWSRKGSAFILILFTFGYCLGSLVWIVYTTISGQVNGNDLIKFSVYFLMNLLPLVYYFMQLKDDKKYVK